MKFAINSSKLPKIIAAIAIAILIIITHSQPSAVQAQSPPGTVVIDGNGSMTPQGANDPHLRLSSVSSLTPEDSKKADRLAKQLKQAISKYERVQNAVDAGYLEFPPNPDENLKIIHYVHPWLSYLESFRIEPEQPGALLYQKQSDGQLRLLGAMYTAPAEATMEELNNRVPLSVTRWHLHTNMCLPEPIWDEQQWQRQKDGRPVFGPDSLIATQAECQQVNGKFEPTVFGWMVHVYPFAFNPEDVFNYQYQGS
jgi:hypothetical protein